MKVHFLEPAQLEFEDAIAHYNAERSGLGDELAAEVYKAIERIIAYPDAWQKVSSNSRRYLIHRFPFGVIYSHSPDEIVVVAVMNLHRNPDVWRDRSMRGE